MRLSDHREAIAHGCLTKTGETTMTNEKTDFRDLSTSSPILLGPGPSMVHPRVLRVMATPVVGFMDPQFLGIMDDVQWLLRAVFQTSNVLTLPISGTGGAGMEAALVNFLEPGDPILVCVNGFFGARMVEIAGRCGAVVARIDVPWGEVVSPEQVDEALRVRPAKVVAIVHGETSTGVRQPLEAIAAVVHQHGALLLVDTVASLGGVLVPVDAIGIDICYTGSQKCLSVPPGLAPITVSARAVDVLNARKTLVQSWYLDLTLIRKYWSQERVYHHTGPITLTFGLREALRLIHEEGLAQVQERHSRVAALLWDGLDRLGLKPIVPREHRLPSLTTVWIPEGVDDLAVRRQLLQEYNIEIAGGLGAFKGRAWRIGLMGHSCRPENVLALLGALERILHGKGSS
jgi:alanine-glyoxylate transaminase / serine-glyoxylate transaminase / serine-pyruvate transaminase